MIGIVIAVRGSAPVTVEAASVEEATQDIVRHECLQNEPENRARRAASPRSFADPMA
jgi:hypothetical protein